MWPSVKILRSLSNLVVQELNQPHLVDLKLPRRDPEMLEHQQCMSAAIITLYCCRQPKPLFLDQIIRKLESILKSFLTPSEILYNQQDT